MEHDFPEPRWPTTVYLIVPVMVGPNTVPGRLQNRPFEDPESEPEKYIQFGLANPRDIVVGQIVTEARFLYGYRKNSSLFQQRSCVREGESVVRRTKHAVVDPSVGEIRQPAAATPDATQ